MILCAIANDCSVHLYFGSTMDQDHLFPGGNQEKKTREHQAIDCYQKVELFQ